MLEKLSKRLVPYGRAHPHLRWPILGLLMLSWCLDGAWAFVRALGREIPAVVREVGQHLRETGLTPQGIHDNAERFLDAGMWAAKKLPGLWSHVRQIIRPWCLARMDAVKETAPAYLARTKAVACRMADALRADLPQYKRHAPRRAMAAALALAMCLGMLPVSAFAAETGCTHDLGQHDEACGYAAAVEGQPCTHTEHVDCGYAEAVPETPCTCGAVADENGNTVHQDGCGYTPATEGTACTHVQGAHDESCGFVEAVAGSPCTHQHDGTCGGLTSEEPPAPVCEVCGEAHETADCPVAPTAAPMLLGEEPTPIVDGSQIYANGAALIIEAGSRNGYTCIRYDQDGDKTIGEDEYLNMPDTTATAEGYDLKLFDIYGGGNTTSLSGDTSITMTGGRVRRVYGGGLSGKVTGKAEVTIGGTATIENVYGGGNSGAISGNTTVNIDGGTVTGYVYGGGESGTVDGSATVTLNKGTVKYAIYGGGNAEAASVGSAAVNINGGEAQSYVYGGGDSGNVSGNTSVTMTGGKVTNGIYGGGYHGRVGGSSTVTLTGGKVMESVYGHGYIYPAMGGATVTVGANAQVVSAYYGVAIKGTASTSGVTSFKIAPSLADDAMVSVYLPADYTPGTIATGAVAGDDAKIKLVGPGAVNRAAYLDGAEIKIKVTTPVTSVRLDQTDTTLAVGKTVTLEPTVEPGEATNKNVTWRSSNSKVATVANGLVTAVAAGSATITVKTADGNHTATCNVTVPTPPPTVSGTDIYANGVALVIEAGTDGTGTTVYIDTNRDGVKDDDEKSLKGANIEFAPEDNSDLSGYTVYGGSVSTAITGDTKITMTGGKVKCIYGGNSSNGNVSGNSTITIDGGTVGNIYGSGLWGSVTGSATITLTSGTVGNIYGGGGPENELDSKYGAVDRTIVKINGGTVTESVYGGGYYGGVGSNTEIKMTNGTVTKNVYGGGYSGPVSGSTNVTIEGGTANIVYGGGWSSRATVQNNTAVTMGGTANVGAIYGGGDGGEVTGNTTVTMNSGTVEELRGGGVATVTGSTTVTMNGGTVNYYVYGGGHGSNEKTGSTAVEINGGTVMYSVYGGGSSSSTNVDGNTAVTIGGTAVVKNNVYGGGVGGTVSGNTAVTIGGTASVGQTVFGGCKSGSVAGGATVTLNGGKVADIYGGGENSSSKTGSTVININDGLVNGSVYGGGSEGSVTGSATVTLNKGTVSYDIYGGGYLGPATVDSTTVNINGGKERNVYGGGNKGSVTGSSGVTVGASAKVGYSSYGVAINGTGVTNGVTSFKIDSSLTEDAAVNVCLPEGYTTGTIATNAVEGDAAKINLVGKGATGKEAYFDSGSIKVRAASVAVTGVDLNKIATTLAVGKTETLRATVTPSDATDKKVKWSSDNTSVANVMADGLVTAKAVGTAIITVTTEDGGKTATCTVTVSKIAITPAVTLVGWTYGETANDPAVTGNTGGGAVSYTYKLSTAADSTYESTVPINAGTYMVKATIAQAGNYQGGSATATFTIAKASQSAPSAPTATAENIGSTQITLAEISGAQYSKDGTNWQDSPTFTGLVKDTSYTFYARLKGDDNHNASPGSTGAAIKTSNIYTVTFDSQGATTAADPATKTVTPPASKVDELPTAPSKTGHDFGGWFTAANGGGTAFTADTTVTADITVYAKWTITPTEKTPTPVFENGFNLALGGDEFDLTNDYASKENTENTVYKLYAAATGSAAPSGMTAKSGDYGGFYVSGVTTSTDCYVTATAPGFLESDRVAIRLLAVYAPTDGATASGSRLTIKTPQQLQNFLNYSAPGAATLAGNTVTLTKDTLICYDLTLKADFNGVLDLDGKTLTHNSGTSGWMLAIYENVTLTLKNGTMMALGHPALTQVGGTVTLEDMTMDGAHAAMEIVAGSFTMTDTTLRVVDRGQHDWRPADKAYTSALRLYADATVSIVSGVLKNDFAEGYTFLSSSDYTETTPKPLADCIAPGSTSVPADSTAETFDEGTEDEYTLETCKETITVTSGPIVAVTGITGVPTAAAAGTGLALVGTVVPANATGKTIVWSVKSADTTGATIAGTILKTTAAGMVTVTATIKNGRAVGIDFTQDFTITVTAPPDGILSAPLSQAEVDSAFGPGSATFVSPDKVVIHKDLDLKDSIKIETDVAIDLNGNTITGATGDDGNGKPAFTVDAGKTVTITDGKGGGAVIGGAGSDNDPGNGGNGGAGISGPGNVVVGGGSSVTGGAGGNASGGGNGGNGGNGVDTSGNVTVKPGGSTTGGAGGGGTTGGSGGNGTDTSGSGSVTVDKGGSASGGQGGTGTTGSGGAGGNGTQTENGSTTNSGTTTGGNGGSSSSGTGGTGGSGSGSTGGNIDVGTGGSASGGQGGSSGSGNGGMGGSGTDTSGNVTVGNGGSVTGGAGGNGASGGTGGSGADITGSGSVTVDKGGSASGGQGGTGTTGIGGAGGNGTQTENGSTTNSGTTIGGNGGSSSSGTGGTGGSGSGSTDGNIDVGTGGSASGGQGGSSGSGNGGDGGSGADTSGNVTVKPGGNATGGEGGNGTTGGAGGDGANSTDSGTVTVDKGGSASGGQGGTGTTGSGGAGGNGTQTKNGSTTNSGTTIGGNGGSASSGTGGIGGNGSDSTGGNIDVGTGGAASGGQGGSSVSGNGGNGGNGADTSGNITVNPGGNAGGGAGGNGATGGSGGDGTSTSGSGSTTVNGGANGGQGGTSSGSGQTGGPGGNGSSSSDSGSIDIGTGGSASGGQGGSSGSGNGGAGGSGSTSTGSGNVNVGGGGTSTGGIGGAGGNASGNAGGTGGSGTSTGSSGNTTVDGAITGGTGGQGGTDAGGGNGGTGGSGAIEDGTITGSGTITGGNGGNISAGGGGQPGNGGSAITGGGSAATPGGPTTLDGKKGVNANAKVDNTQNDSGATITVPKEEDMVDAAVTDAERENADNSITKIDVALNIVNKTAEKPNAGSVSGALAGTGATEVGVYLDITLEKSVTKITGDSIKTLVTDAVKPLTITITIPASMRGGSNFTVIRVHGDDVKALPTHYDPVNHTLTISSDKFSTYAIAYTPETPVAPPTPPYGGGSDSSSTSSAPAPVVTKPDGGTVTLNPTRPRPGQTVTVTPKPDEGYMVDQITVTDKDGKNVPVKENSDGTYSFTQPKTGVTVTATFKPVEVRLPWNPFTDVAESNWFYGSVRYVYEKGLMNGTSGTTFSPNMTTSRGTIVATLWRLEGEPDATGANPFTDVSADAYYAKAVAWAAENGIVKGYGNGNFGPDEPITREQLVSILYRYSQFKGQETPTEGIAIGNFIDNDQVSTFARDAMRWALGQGIVSGKGNNILDPKGNATRAETSKMLTYLLA